MDLVKQTWTKEDIKEYSNYLLSLTKGKDKAEMEKKIANTGMKCIAVQSADIKRVINQIYKGNYLEFLDFFSWNNLSETFVIGGLISKLKDFELVKKYLNKYAMMSDNWATCDTLKFKITDKNAELFFDLAKHYLTSIYTFKRRIGVILLLKMVGIYDTNKILLVVSDLVEEREYYVNMAIAWLISECFVKDRNTTLNFFKNNNLNKFVINKAISKCRDSFRVSTQDKELLLNFRKK